MLRVRRLRHSQEKLTSVKPHVLRTARFFCPARCQLRWRPIGAIAPAGVLQIRYARRIHTLLMRVCSRVLGASRRSGLAQVFHSCLRSSTLNEERASPNQAERSALAALPLAHQSVS